MTKGSKLIIIINGKPLCPIGQNKLSVAPKEHGQRTKLWYFLAFWDGISRMKRLNRASNKENIMVDRQVKV